MNTLLDIWHRHTFKITAVLVTPLLLAFFVSKAQAEEIEEVVVVAQQVEVITTNPLQNESLIEEIIPEFTFLKKAHSMKMKCEKGLRKEC